MRWLLAVQGIAILRLISTAAAAVFGEDSSSSALGGPPQSTGWAQLTSPDAYARSLSGPTTSIFYHLRFIILGNSFR